MKDSKEKIKELKNELETLHSAYNDLRKEYSTVKRLLDKKSSEVKK